MPQLRAVKSILLLLLIITPLASCNVAAQSSAVAPAATPWIRTDLYFGLTRRDSSPIPDADFQSFIDQTVTPAFPDGFTLTPTAGQYLDSHHLLHKEPSRVLTLLYPRSDAPACDRKIHQITAAYCKRFDQESVLRSDTATRAEFLSAP